MGELPTNSLARSPTAIEASETQVARLTLTAEMRILLQLPGNQVGGTAELRFAALINPFCRRNALTSRLAII